MSDALTIAENERRFAAQQLHDQAIQTLLQLNMQIGICKQFFALGQKDETENELNELERQIALASQQLRELIADLRPPTSDDGSFHSSLNTILETHHQRGGPVVHCQYAIPSEPSDRSKLALLRIIQEGLTNVRKHSQAGQVNLTIAMRDNNLYFQLSDDGVGFAEMPTYHQNGKKMKTGLLSMRIRAELLHGKFKVDSQPNNGTIIKGVLPA
ncbi:MAG: ATP-binding protein [Chloroflexota bacterium]